MEVGLVFDIFCRLPDGSPLWLESVEGLAEAKKRLARLERMRPGNYFLYSEKTGGVVSDVPQRNLSDEANETARDFAVMYPRIWHLG